MLPEFRITSFAGGSASASAFRGRNKTKRTIDDDIAAVLLSFAFSNGELLDGRDIVGRQELALGHVGEQRKRPEMPVHFRG